MSIEATLATWKLTKEQVSPTEKLFLLSCANRAGENHECWPSLRRLIEDTGLDRKTIIKIRQSVIEKKHMEYTGEHKGHSNQIPIMRLTYVDKLDEILDQNFTSTTIGTSDEFGTSTTFGTSTKNGTGTSTNIGTGTSTNFGTLNLKEESINRNKKIGTSTEVQNFDYALNKKKQKTKESDYCNNHQDTNQIDIQLIEPERESERSDYFDNQSKLSTESKSQEHFGIKNILETNVFQIPEQIIQDWITNRKKKRLPIISTAWACVNKNLEKLKEQGVEPIEAFETMVASGWQSLKVEYFVSKEVMTKQEQAKKRSIELEQLAEKRKQQEIKDSKNFKATISKASEIARAKMREIVGARAPGFAGA